MEPNIPVEKGNKAKQTYTDPSLTSAGTAGLHLLLLPSNQRHRALVANFVLFPRARKFGFALFLLFFFKLS